MLKAGKIFIYFITFLTFFTLVPDHPRSIDSLQIMPIVEPVAVCGNGVCEPGEGGSYCPPCPKGQYCIDVMCPVSDGYLCPEDCGPIPLPSPIPLPTSLPLPTTKPHPTIIPFPTTRPPYPNPTCIPRPACLDANPACLLMPPDDGFWCPPGPMPTYKPYPTPLPLPTNIPLPTTRPFPTSRPYPTLIPLPEPTCIPRPACLSWNPDCAVGNPHGIFCPPGLVHKITPYPLPFVSDPLPEIDRPFWYRWLIMPRSLFIRLFSR